MTGRYPIRMRMSEFVIYPETRNGIPWNETTIAEVLKSGGYTTRAVGKWHVGFYTWKHTPTFRGFDSFYGIYTGSGGYYSHLGWNR